MTDGIRIHDLPPAERPRERLASRGADALRSAELIAILLRTGVRGASAMDVAEALLHRFGTLEALARAPLDQLRIKGVGRDKAIALKAAFTLARRMAEELRNESPVLDNPEAVASVVRDELAVCETEVLKVLLLNTRHRLLRIETVSTGVLDQVLAHPREVFRSAISNAAAAIILVHNHPSGDPSPSEADIRMTRDFIRAGDLLRIPVQDHVILGRRAEHRPHDYCSLRQLGYFRS